MKYKVNFCVTYIVDAEDPNEAICIAHDMLNEDLKEIGLEIFGVSAEKVE